jgi:hypothetical protein
MMIRRGSCYHDCEREDPGMGSARKYAVIDPAIGKIGRRIFSEQRVYDDEMDVSGAKATTAPPACSSRTTSTTGVR